MSRDTRPVVNPFSRRSVVATKDDANPSASKGPSTDSIPLQHNTAPKLDSRKQTSDTGESGNRNAGAASTAGGDGRSHLNNTQPVSLHDAVASGDFDMVQRLVRRGADVNSISETMRTPLEIASCNPFREDVDIVKFLVESGANLWSTPTTNTPYLHTQVYMEHAQMATTLVGLGLNVERRDAEHMTPLLLAAKHNSTTLLDTFISLGANLNAIDNDGNSAVMVAAASGHADIVEFLQKAGADLNIRNIKGSTALHLAAAGNYSHVCGTLLQEEGILGLKVRDGCGATPLHIAAEAGHTMVLRRLKNKFAKDPLQDSIWNLRTRDGSSALHCAAVHGRHETGLVLIEDGIDVQVVNYDGMTPLRLAVIHRKSEFVKVLIQQGGKKIINQKASSPYSTFLDSVEPVGRLGLSLVVSVPVLSEGLLLLLALIRSSPMTSLYAILGLIISFYVVKLIDKAGQAPNKAREHTMFLWRVKTGGEVGEVLALCCIVVPHTIAVMYLIHHSDTPSLARFSLYAVMFSFILFLLGPLESVGHRLRIINVRTNTMPLHLAVNNSDAEMVQLLIDNGAEIEARNDAGKTAYALAGPSNPARRILISAGANVKET